MFYHPSFKNPLWKSSPSCCSLLHTVAVIGRLQVFIYLHFLVSLLPHLSTRLLSFTHIYSHVGPLLSCAFLHLSEFPSTCFLLSLQITMSSSNITVHATPTHHLLLLPDPHLCDQNGTKHKNRMSVTQVLGS